MSVIDKNKIRSIHTSQGAYIIAGNATGDLIASTDLDKGAIGINNKPELLYIKVISYIVLQLFLYFKLTRTCIII